MTSGAGLGFGAGMGGRGGRGGGAAVASTAAKPYASLYLATSTVPSVLNMNSVRYLEPTWVPSSHCRL
jgi:hypothetical protein